MGNNYTKLIGSPGSYQYQTEVNPLYADNKFLQYIIGRAGVPGCDFNFTAPANTTQQNIAIGAVLLAQYVPNLIVITCLETVNDNLLNPPDMFRISLGSTSAGVDYIPLSICNLIDNVIETRVIPKLDFSVPNSLFFGGVPTINWSTLISGKWMLKVFYDDFNLIPIV
jgi:hypothetical protein